MRDLGRARFPWSAVVLGVVLAIGAAPIALATKPAAPSISASICYAPYPPTNPGGQPLLVTLWSYSAPKGADQVRGYGSSDGGATWTNFDTRGTNGDSSRSGSLYVSVYDWGGWSLVRVELLRSAGAGWKVMATSDVLSVATPYDQNPACPAGWPV